MKVGLIEFLWIFLLDELWLSSSGNALFCRISSMGGGKALIRRAALSRWDIAGYGICQSATQG